MARTKHTALQSKRSIIYTVVIAILAVAALVMSAMSLFRTMMTEEMVAYQQSNAFAMSVVDVYSPLTIDAPTKTTFIPELNLQFDYDNYTSHQLRYNATVEDESGDKGDVYVSTARELRSWSFVSTDPRAITCKDPYHIIVNGDSNSGNEGREIVRSTLADGRTAILYASTLTECGAYIDSDESVNLQKVLRSMQSY